MDTAEMHLLMADELNHWDPFCIGDGSYDTEIADVIQAVHQFDDRRKLAARIREIYEFSFEEALPLESCEGIAGRLLTIKSASSCTL